MNAKQVQELCASVADREQAYYAEDKTRRGQNQAHAAGIVALRIRSLPIMDDVEAQGESFNLADAAEEAALIAFPLEDDLIERAAFARGYAAAFARAAAQPRVRS